MDNRYGNDEIGRGVRFLRAVLAGVGSIVGVVLLLPIVLLTIPLWVVRAIANLGTRIIRRLQPAETTWGELIRYEPEVGWKPHPDLDVHARASGLFHLTTDGEGWRGRMALDEAHLVVMGDSFAFGHGADDEHLFTEFAGGVHMKSVGANGYNLVQSLMWMERLAPRLDGKVIAWFVYYDNDLLENLLPFQRHYRMPFVRRVDGEDGWEVVTEHVSPDPWPFPESRDYTTRLAEICSPSRLSRRVFSAADFLIERGRKACEEAGARLAVVGIPSPELVRPDEAKRLAGLLRDPSSFDPRLPDRRLSEICDRRGVPFLPLAEHLGSGDYLPDDCHWTRRGHRKVGRLLGDLHHRMVDVTDGSRTSGHPTPSVEAPSEAPAEATHPGGAD